MDDAAQIHYQRSQHLCDLARWREAIIEANKCLSTDPHHYRALCTISRCHFELGDFKKSLEFSHKAIEADPTQEWAYRLQSCVYSQKNDKKRNFQHALEAVKQEPESVLALQTLAYAQLHKRKYKDATETAEKIRRIAPDSIDAHKTLGYVEFAKGNLEIAEEHFRRALKIEANDYNSLNSLGEILMQKYDRTYSSKMKKQFLNEAIDSFRQAITVNPTLPEAKKNLKEANFKSLSSSPVFAIPVVVSLFALFILLFNRKSSPVNRPEFFNLEAKPPDLLFIYVVSWLCFIISLYWGAAIYAQKGLTEPNRKFLEVIEYPNLKGALVAWGLLIFSFFPILFVVWKSITLDFEFFYTLKALDWITLLIGFLGFFLNFKLVSPLLFGKNKSDDD